MTTSAPTGIASGPNPFRDPRPFYEVYLGGVLIAGGEGLPEFVEVGGVKVTDEYAKQKGTSSNGVTWVFRGTTPPEKIECTFEAVDESAFDLLTTLFDMLAPVPGTGGTGGVAASVVPTVQAPTQQNTALITGPGSLINQPAAAPTVASTATGSATGPKPPTLQIVNAIINWGGMVDQVSRGEFEAPTCTETNSWRCKVSFVPAGPVTPANATPQAPATTPASPGGTPPSPLEKSVTDAAAAAFGT